MSSNNAVIIGVGIQDNVSRGLQNISSKMRAWGRNYASIGSELTQGLTRPIVVAAAAMLKFTGDLDALKKALAVTMGGVRQAEDEFKKLKKSAEVPGMGLEEAIKGSLNLQALGASAEQARYAMENLAKGVALSGGGQWEFERVMTQFIQMAGNGKILNEDLKFMFAAAPALRGAVTEAFGTSDPEALRGMMSTSEFIDGMLAQLAKMPPVTDSVKNSLENAWTSIRVGAGEIGAAILGATSWEQALLGLSGQIDALVKRIVEWIKANRDSIGTWAKVIAGIAITGPIIRLAANLVMIGSALVKVMQTTRLLGNAFDLLGNKMFTAGGKGQKAWSWAGKAGGAMLGINLIGNAFNGGDADVTDFDKRYNQNRLNNSGSVPLGSDAGFRFEAFNRMVTAGAALDFDTAGEFGKRMLSGGALATGSQTFDPLNPFGSKNMNVGVGKPDTTTLDDYISSSSYVTKKIGGDDDKEKLRDYLKEYEEGMKRINIEWNLGATDAEDAIEARLSLLKETIVGLEMQGKGSKTGPFRDQFAFWQQAQRDSEKEVEPDYQWDPKAFAMQMGDGDGKSSTLEDSPLFKALTQYEEGLKRVDIAQKLGATSAEMLEMQMGNLKSVIVDLSLAEGDNTAQLDEWIQKYNDLFAAQTKVAEEQERQKRLAQTAARVLDGVSDVFEGLFEGGEKGAKKMSSALKKVVIDLIKTALMMYIQSLVSSTGPGAAVAVGVGGGVMLGAITSLLGKVSMADGGILTGPSLIRAGEYPGASANPEVIAPLNKLKQYIGGGNSQISGWIRGRDIYLSTMHEHMFADRIGAPKIV